MEMYIGFFLIRSAWFVMLQWPTHQSEPKMTAVLAPETDSCRVSTAFLSLTSFPCLIPPSPLHKWLLFACSTFFPPHLFLSVGLTVPSFCFCCPCKELFVLLSGTKASFFTLHIIFNTLIKSFYYDIVFLWVLHAFPQPWSPLWCPNSNQPVCYASWKLFSTFVFMCVILSTRCVCLSMLTIHNTDTFDWNPCVQFCRYLALLEM